MLAWGGLRKQRRYVHFAVGLGLIAMWCVTINALHRRASAIANRPLHSIEEANRIFGRPDSILTYAEGDCDWVYSVRVWPWNEAMIVSIYKNHLLGTSYDSNATLFYRPKITSRTPKDAMRIRKMLAIYDEREGGAPEMDGGK